MYNAASFLAESVASALAQPELAELLLVDDGSSDGSLALAKSLEAAHNTIRVLQHPNGAHQGPGASRNWGLAQAQGPLIAFLDADDVYLPGRFEQAISMLEKSPDCDGIYEAVGLLPTSMAHNKPSLTTLTPGIAPQELFFRVNPIGRQGYFHLNGLTLRKSVLEKAGPFHEHLPLAQDTDWMLRLCAACILQPGSLQSPVALRRIHPANRSTNEAELRRHKPLMALACLHTGAQMGLSVAHLGALLQLYLRYRWEELHLSGAYGRMYRKWRDLRDGLYIWYRFPQLRSNAYLTYHLRSTFKLPIRQHLDYYAAP